MVVSGIWPDSFQLSDVLKMSPNDSNQKQISLLKINAVLPCHHHFDLLPFSSHGSVSFEISSSQ